MELIYLWLEKLGNKKEQSINFSQNYKFELKKLKNEKIYELISTKIDDTNKIPENYFGKNISNISCIIGENGSGKSTLMKFILEICTHSQKKKFKIKYLLIFKNSKNNFSIKTNLPKNNLKSDIQNEAQLDMLEPLYFCSAFNSSVDFPNNISFETTINVPIFNIKYFFNTFNSQRDFLIMEYILKNDLKYKIPYPNLKAKISKMQEEFVFNFRLKNNIYSEENNKIASFNDIFDKINIKNNNNNNFKINFALEIWGNMIDKKNILALFPYHDDELLNSLFDAFKKRFTERKNETDVFEWLEIQNKIWKVLLTKHMPLLWQEILSSSTNNIDKYDFDIKFGKLIEDRWIINSEILKIPVNDYLKNKNLKNWVSYSRFLEFFFTPQLSNGEYTLLYLLAQINKHFELNNSLFTRDKRDKNPIFILEELESFLHPEWQREIIKLLNTIADIFLGGKKIQFM